MKLFNSLLLALSAEAGIGRNVVEMVKSATHDNENRLMEQWGMWKKAFKKTYETLEEEIERMEIWLANMAHIEKHNFEYALGEKTFTLGMNHYGDLSSKEFASTYNGFLHAEHKTRGFKGGDPYLDHVNADELEVPKEMDWREHGLVTDVKDQGQCGSCWAFSSTGALEGQMMKHFGKLPNLSEQNLVDCSQNWGNFGCGGGLMDQGFTYIHDNKGIDTEASYPYTAMDGKCVFNSANVGATLSDCKDIPSGNEGALANAINMVGPMSVAIDASHSSFQLYTSGVYYEPECSSQFLDHGVTAVGYGTDSTSGNDFYIVKNSWGTTWGDQGYIMMSRNRSNNCGIASASSYPIV
jgi:cathepsin L